MDIDRLIEALQRPDAYPHPADDLELHHTHASVVFLAGPCAYKIKKPVNLGFLDFSTPERRLHFCREEVRLNRRLAPGVYHGVVPITDAEGQIRIDGAGRVVEHAVKMERLPPRATLLARLERRELSAQPLEELGRRIAAFHAGAQAGPEIAACARWEAVAANARENFEQAQPHVETTISRAVFRRLEALTEAHLERLRPLIERRAREGVPRDAHGDIHLEHVYCFPDRPPPRDFIVIDCIEFNERFRYADPVADTAFLFMDLAYRGRRDLAERLADAYFEAAGDPEGRRLLPFYVAYRAAVRGKVKGILAHDEEVPASVREEAVPRARAYWLLTLGELEEPDERPGLILVAGLPATGKSALAAMLAERAGFRVVSSDRVRKELAGLDAGTVARAPFGEGIYTDAWNERTYRECLARAARFLFEGERVLVDAGFRVEARRRTFLDAAAALAVPALILLCSAPPDAVRARMAAREPGASDADWSIYERAAELWETSSPQTVPFLREVPSGESPGHALEAALHHLRAARLLR